MKKVFLIIAFVAVGVLLDRFFQRKTTLETTPVPQSENKNEIGRQIRPAAQSRAKLQAISEMRSHQVPERIITAVVANPGMDITPLALSGQLTALQVAWIQHAQDELMGTPDAEKLPEKPSASNEGEQQRLKRERHNASEMASAISSILNSPSFPDRVEKYCRFTAESEERNFHEHEDVSQCQIQYLNGLKQFPSDTWFREKAEGWRRKIAEIDSRLKPVAVTSGPAYDAKRTAPTEPNERAAISDQESDSANTAVNPQKVYRVGNGVSVPAVLLKVDPAYSEEARRARLSGTVLLSMIIEPNGKARDIAVAKRLGLGLDEKAIEAVAQWRFRPSMKNGQPVAVQATVAVNFRLFP